MTRRTVFFLRLAATSGLFLLVFAAARLLWYPGAYFVISGVSRLLLVLAGIVLVIGPGLTTFLFKPGKKGLVGDMWVVSVVEIIAVAVAASMIYVRQPFYAVFAVDRFEAVSKREIDLAQVGHAVFHSRPGHEPRLVFAELPDDPEVLSNLIDQTVFEGKQDIDRRPEFWKPYAAGIPAVKAAAQPLEKLLEGDERRAATVLRWLAGQRGGRQDFVYLPLRGKDGDAAVILHADIGFPVATLAVDPW